MQNWVWLFSVCEIVGTFAGLYAAYLTTKGLLESRWSRSVERPPTISRAAAWIVGIAVAPFIWFLAFVVGGSFGGGYGEVLGLGTGVPSRLIIPAGIGIGIFLTVWLGVAVASCAAFALVRSIERISAHSASKSES